MIKDELKEQIKQVIKTNDNQEITGANMQSSLMQIIDASYDNAGLQFNNFIAVSMPIASNYKKTIQYASIRNNVAYDRELNEVSLQNYSIKTFTHPPYGIFEVIIDSITSSVIKCSNSRIVLESGRNVMLVIAQLFEISTLNSALLTVNRLPSSFDNCTLSPISTVYSNNISQSTVHNLTNNLISKSNIGDFTFDNSSGNILDFSNSPDLIGRYSGILIPVSGAGEYVFSNKSIEVCITLLSEGLDNVIGYVSANHADSMFSFNKDDFASSDIVNITTTEDTRFIGISMGPPYKIPFSTPKLEKGTIPTTYLPRKSGLRGFVTYDDKVNFVTKILFQDVFRLRNIINIFYEKDCFVTDFRIESKKIPIISSPVYVSTNGLDTNSGTYNSPFLTLQKALSTNSNTIYLHSGTYEVGVNLYQDLTLEKAINLIGIDDVTVDFKGGNSIIVKKSCYMENITFVNGHRGSLRTYVENNSDEISFNNCQFNNQTNPTNEQSAQGGLKAQGGKYFLYRCKAKNNAKDGFNYHSLSGAEGKPDIVEIECEGRFNGLASDYYSENGSTAHDGAHILRLNCYYSNNNGGNIADVNSGTHSVNIGCLCEISELKNENYPLFKSDYQCIGPNMIMEVIGCKAFGSTYDISCDNAAVTTDLTSDHNIAANGGVIQYHPLNYYLTV